MQQNRNKIPSRLIATILQININNPLKAKVTFTIFILIGLFSGLLAQEKPVSEADSTLLKPLFPADSTGVDSTGVGVERETFQLSQDSLDAPVNYSALDSMIYDIQGQKIHLFGSAEVTYQTIKLNASHIIFDWQTNVVTAEGMPDSTGTMAGLPVFKDGDQEFTAERMRYNFQSRKGVIYEVTTQQNDVVVKGSKSKFVSGERIEGDTTSEVNDYVFSADALFTTCTHDEPHYGIRSRKQKVIPNKLVVVGPSNLELMGVPTPLWLPFGFFPITQGRRTGLLFPRDYEYSQQWGFGLRDVGWFFPLGEHFNLSLTANLYLKGTWGVNARSNYRKRYKYNGNFDLGYDSRRSEAADGTITRTNSFRFQWSHRQDRTAHPTNNFGGSINIQTNGYQSNVFNDQRVLDNQLRSNLTFSKVWQDKPFNLNVAFSHNQNTATERISITFPSVQFRTQALYPFKRKTPSGGKEQWYERITFRYSGEASNRFDATDSTLFTQQTLEDAQFGIRHDVTGGTSFKILKYLNLNPSITYKETWYMRTLERQFNPGIEVDTINNNGLITYDTTAFGMIEDINRFGFKAWRQYSVGVGLNTQLFGTVLFKKGKIRGLRHLMKPSVSLSFSPNYQNPALGYFRTVRSETVEDGEEQYSIFRDGIFGSPPNSGQAMALSYSINNIFEAKYFSNRDSTNKKLKLFDNIIVNGNYNFAADSLKWSPVRVNGTTRLFKGITTFSASATFDPYTIDDNGRRIDRFAWNANRQLLRFVDANARFNTNITVGKIRALFQGEEEEVVEDLNDQRKNDPRPQEKDFLSLFENFSISHNLVMRWETNNEGRDTFRISTNTVNFRGSIQLTDNWRINIGSFGYDFNAERITYPSFGVSRDLHCWQMDFNWAPNRGTYQFSIYVKPGSLDFIKIPYARNNADGLRAFQ
ncbi:MAG: hypothetical protein MRY78_08920 [Saprospiraceae bacterium]|nr:hypothetical protein [Saprospiraceae bacterium]